MIEPKNGEHTNWTSPKGVKYWICNINGKYHIETQYGSVRRPTQEIKENIKLV